MKKLLLGFGALATGLALLPMLAAFEAHVINVTATIENALTVQREEIQFGTVFPQEYLREPLGVGLSQSFLDEDRVDDVDYIIRQKPKCGITSDDGKILDHSSTATGHVIVDPQAPNGYRIDCGPTPRRLIDVDLPETPQNDIESWDVLPLLCPYLSKHPDGVNDNQVTSSNDQRLPSFHQPFTIENDQVKWNDTKGHLAKSQSDTVDDWIIDLAVPCFGGFCAQDWADFVATHNDQANPDDYVGNIEDEHKVYGCDLWVEVTGVSLPGLGCNEKVDLMLVLDRSGSISNAELLTLQSAAKAFVDALALSTAGNHAGSVSFSTLATLDSHLTDDAVALKAAIDAIDNGGLTNLEDAILDATAELANPGDGHDRADGDSPDFMVIITDGSPTASNGPFSDAVDAANAADAARAAGIEIYVVGVGTTAGTADYLKNEIANDAAHYFDAADFDDLQAILDGLASCNGG